MRIFDCVILAQWGEMGLLERRFRAYQDNPDVTHVICEPAPSAFKDSDLAGQWHGRWNHVIAEAREITGNTPAEREACLREYLLHGFSGDPDDLILFSDIRVIPEVPAGVRRRDVTRMADLTR